MESSGSPLFGIVMLGMMAFIVAGFWRVFAKAGKPGWACLVPIYNGVVMLQIAGRPAWWLLLFFIPIVNLIVSFIVVLDIAKNFGKGVGFGLGLMFLAPIFYPILGFGSAAYEPAH